MFVRQIFKDILLSFVLSFVLFLILKFWLHVDDKILPYISGLVFVIIFLFASSMSFYLFKLKDQIEMLNVQIDRLKRYDEISSVFKRNYVMDMVEKYVSISKRQNLPLSVMVLDIDSFKEINKFYGIEVGDEILRELGEILKKETREMDIVGRYGGDEFILVSLVSKNEAEYLANDIHKAILAHTFKGGIKLFLSIGISELKKDDNYEKLLKRAEEALFLAKQKGGNRVDFLEHFLLFE
jgi:diguanylate cyclase (GGDEF)-like protein